MNGKEKEMNRAKIAAMILMVFFLGAKALVAKNNEENANENDAVLKINAAMDVFNQRMSKLQEWVRGEFDELISSYADRGDIKTVQILEAGKQEFLEQGTIPDGKTYDVMRRRAYVDQVRAHRYLDNAYKGVIEELTKSRKFTEAIRLQDEWEKLKTSIPAPAAEKRVVIPDIRKNTLRSGFKVFRIVAQKSNPNGWEAYYREIRLYDAQNGTQIQGGKAFAAFPPLYIDKDGKEKTRNPNHNPQGQAAAAEMAFDGDYETKYRTLENPGVNKDWIEYSVQRPVRVGRVIIDQISQHRDDNHIFCIELLGSNDRKEWVSIMRAEGLGGHFDSATGRGVAWFSR